TSGSNSTESSGGALRQVAAEVRQILLTMAAERLGAPVDRLRVADGLIVDPVSEDQISYWDLQGGRPLQRQATGTAQAKSPETSTLLGPSVPRVDIPGKVLGEPIFVADMELPGMPHGRV